MDSSMNSLEDFVGEHLLGGVDYASDGSANGINILVDGRAFTFIEDENDGYRSMLGEILEIAPTRIKNQFSPVLVSGTIDGEILTLARVAGDVVITVGTDTNDSYYPYFVHNFDPTVLGTIPT